MYYFPDYEGQYGLVGACAQNESQPMHGMFAFDLTGLKGWPVVGACDAYWSTFDSGVLRVGGFAGSAYYTNVWIGQCFLSCAATNRTWYEVGACDVFHMDIHERDICMVGGYRSSIGQCGCFTIEPWSRAWSSIIVGAYLL